MKLTQFVLTCACICLCTPLVSTHVHAQHNQTLEHGRYHDTFYGELRTNRNESCCNNHDCRPVSGTTTQTSNGRYVVSIAGDIVLETDMRTSIIRKETPDCGVHVCLIFETSPHGNPPGQRNAPERASGIRCLVLPKDSPRCMS